MTVGKLHERLKISSPEERTRLLAKILREARDTDVWKFTTPMEVKRSEDRDIGKCCAIVFAGDGAGKAGEEKLISALLGKSISEARQEFMETDTKSQTAYDKPGFHYGQIWVCGASTLRSPCSLWSAQQNTESKTIPYPRREEDQKSSAIAL